MAAIRRSIELLRVYPGLVPEKRSVEDESSSESAAGSAGIEETQSSKTDSLEAYHLKSTVWSPDGTCLFANSSDNRLRTFVLPVDLLEHQGPSSPAMQPYTTLASPEPIYALVPHPFFQLSDSSSTLVLTSHRDHPIRLTNVLDPDASITASYSLVCPTTEAYTTPHSLSFLPSGTQFAAGTDSLISIFDVVAYSANAGPIARLPTIPSKRHKMKGGGVGMRGIVSALRQQPTLARDGSGMLAAGTWTRCVGLYDAAGLGGTVATWNISSAADDVAKVAGGGISQVEWSACGRYLLLAERRSTGVLVYDVRVAGRLVAWCEGRQARGNQRLGIAVVPGRAENAGDEVWAGGEDGFVRVWTRLGQTEGAVKPTWEWHAHDSSIGSVGLHPSGAVAATCSGQRPAPGAWLDGDDTDSDGEESSCSELSQASSSTSPVSAKSFHDSDHAHRRFALRDRDVDTMESSIKLWRLD
jgi:WD40 repeat protein